MKLAQFTARGSDSSRLGVLVNEKLVEVAALARSMAAPAWLAATPNMAEVIRRGAGALDELRALSAAGATSDEYSYSIDEVTFLPPVYPGKILAIGRNYYDHAVEGGVEPPPAPLIFTKLPTALNAHNAPIVVPAISEKVDYEAELAVIIGRRAKQVSEAEAWDYIFGYSLINDVSARDLQFGDGQWVRGKGLDGFAPLGPFITTREEIPDVHALNIEGRLNGQVMQTSHTSKMIFRIPYLISYISQGITLEPGDVIATGTPEGVGVFRKPPVLLKPGDVFEVTVEKLGTLRNPFVAPPSES